MKRMTLCLITVALVGCGADGAPFTPSANVGMSLNNGNVSTGASIGASNGTVSVGVGL